MKLVFEKSLAGRGTYQLPKSDLGPRECRIDPKLLRDKIDLPEVGEVEVVRHYTNLSRRSFGVDLGFYPLGSCTMKYNPKINEDMARLASFATHHPNDPDSISQGSLQLLYELQDFLKEITGMPGITLQPAAGAHGELTGVMLMQAYFKDRGDNKRKKILIPDSAHGTNPATANMCGFEVVQVNSGSDGFVDLNDLRAKMTDEVVGMMLTIPNTLGIFDKNILEISKIIHDKGGLLYMDGANLNAIVGQVKPYEMGVDVMHINLHKTFSTPHGGGGPGSGPVAVNEKLMPYLPVPIVIRESAHYRFFYNIPKTIGRVRAWNGNFGMHVRAYTYIRRHGALGIRRISENAVLNANYIRVKLEPHYNLPYKDFCMHECVFDDSRQKEYGVTTNDIAKRVLDFGFHAPTVYFPIIVHGAIMIEPTETESKETLDQFIAAMVQISNEAQENTEKVKTAPHTTPIHRVDGVKAARNPVLRHRVTAGCEDACC